jgi:DhnA family fructose-bisphosphate aldolase class Ia
MVSIAAGAGADAVMGFAGIFKSSAADFASLGAILNLTASTTRGQHTRKTQVSSVEHALSLGADCVAVHVNISSAYETEMLSTMGKISSECTRFGLPLMAIMYPRREEDGRDDNYELLRSNAPAEYTRLVRHAVRVGVELGADVIKTQYTGEVGSFASVVECAMGVPVLIAGGPLQPAEEVLLKAREAICAGAAGVSFGRNVFLRDNVGEFLQLLRGIIHGVD